MICCVTLFCKLQRLKYDHKIKMYNHWKGGEKQSLFADDMIYIFTQKWQANKLKSYLK